jgi:hypothetical protein
MTTASRILNEFIDTGFVGGTLSVKKSLWALLALKKAQIAELGGRLCFMRASVIECARFLHQLRVGGPEYLILIPLPQKICELIQLTWFLTSDKDSSYSLCRERVRHKHPVTSERIHLSTHYCHVLRLPGPRTRRNAAVGTLRFYHSLTSK